MTDIKTIEAGKYNKLLSEELKKIPEIKKPEWVDFVKSSTHKARPIFEPDFWHKRSASILRQIYLNEVVGVERLRTRYGMCRIDWVTRKDSFDVLKNNSLIGRIFLINFSQRLRVYI